MKARGFATVLMLAVLSILLSACADTSAVLQDGYYTAEEADFNAFGWKEFMTIYVSGGKIVTVEYDAKNASGFVRSWDMDYMRTMRVTDKTYPNAYARSYKVALLNWQDPSMVDAVSGATVSHVTFQALAEAAMAQARAGDKQVAFIDAPSPGQETAED